MALTLSRYVARQFAWAVCGMLAALTGLVALFDLIELLRRAATRDDASFAIVATISGLRIPFIVMEILPFAVLLGGIMAFWRLTRSSELVVARAAGVSVWQFVSAPVLTAFILGAIATTTLSPLSSAMLARAEQMDVRYLRSGGGPFALAGGKLWLRQADRTGSDGGVAILHARTVTANEPGLDLQEVSIFRLDAEDRFVGRIEAPQASLLPGRWRLEEAREILADRAPSAPRVIEFPTDLTVERVQDSFASPGTLSFWALPDFIALLEASGFSSIRHRLHLNALLALPLLTAVMALVAAGFSMRPARRGRVAQMLAGGVAAGFALFIITKVANEFGQSGALPVELAAWAPAAAGLMLAIALLLHLEDG